jgi:hypothetical protein
VVFSQFFWPAALQQVTGYSQTLPGVPDGDGARHRNDRSTARRLDGDAG